ncbi:MAG TPA: ATP-dependent DNA helicase RecG [Actinomycetota bacterium]|jgi:ATP-dependent DNA helicase RecG|nr:ATP-dependent DNA helicase RecG [Actinomycetota bacterium]
MPLTLDSPVSAIDRRLANRRTGVQTKGPPASDVLAGIEIETVRDLLHHYPRRYIDRSEVSRIRDLRVGLPATVIGRVRKVERRRTRSRTTMVTVVLYDGTATIDLVFFNQPWIVNVYREGHEVAASGVMQLYRGRRQLTKHDVELLTADEGDLVHTGRITPVHRATDGITTRTIRELVWHALEQLRSIPDPLPENVVAAEALAAFDGAIRSIHFPATQQELLTAIERLKFDELFALEVGVAFRKQRLESAEPGVSHTPDGPLTERLAGVLPFEPTKAQTRAIEEIDAAMARPRPMNVLLQGDVGSGKTLVALHAALVAIQSGHQAAVMAPTEVLAGQHFRSIEDLLRGSGGPRSERERASVGPPETGPFGAHPYLDPSGPEPARTDGQVSLLDHEPPAEAQAGLTYALLTASVTGRNRAKLLDAIASGEVDLVVGTHALVQEGVAFADLSLAVVDEQHRFGVHQRMALKGKGASPDVLIMTATPIPRTLALTYYGDLDMVVLDEMPKGRRPVETRIARSAEEREAAYDVVRREVAAGRQAFVVCAAIDEANKTEVRAAEVEAERLATKVFPDLSVELLHGRMRPAEKERRMEAYRAGEHHVLISTTVIEVGVDVPNATVMLVENAERFGLAQLHQLRGRIGRGEHASFCILFDESTPDNDDARARLLAMVRTTDGFELADEDLRLRGEGTLFDVKQSGLPDLKLARLAEDLDLVRRARARAFEVIEADPGLEDHPALMGELRARFEHSIDWLFSS